MSIKAMNVGFDRKSRFMIKDFLQISDIRGLFFKKIIKVDGEQTEKAGPLLCDTREFCLFHHKVIAV